MAKSCKALQKDIRKLNRQLQNIERRFQKKGDKIASEIDKRGC